MMNDDMALVREFAAAHRSARHYSVISADRMIDGRMIETGFKPAAFNQMWPGLRAESHAHRNARRRKGEINCPIFRLGGHLHKKDWTNFKAWHAILSDGLNGRCYKFSFCL
jgi:hypothetical protein